MEEAIAAVAVFRTIEGMIIGIISAAISVIIMMLVYNGILNGILESNVIQSLSVSFYTFNELFIKCQAN